MGNNKSCHNLIIYREACNTNPTLHSQLNNYIPFTICLLTLGNTKKKKMFNQDTSIDMNDVICAHTLADK